MTTLDATFRRIVAAYCHRRGWSARRFGAEALGDPGFVSTLSRGRSPRLATADRLLAFMGFAPLAPAFRREVETFLAVTATKASVLGVRAARDPTFVARLRKGVSPRLVTVERVRAWMYEGASAAEREALAEARAGAPASLLEAGATEAPASPTDSTTTQGDPPMQTETIYLSTREAAAFLGLSPRTLDRYRVSGEGPAFHKFGSRVRYLKGDVEAWAAARRRRSTSDDGLGRAA